MVRFALPVVLVLLLCPGCTSLTSTELARTCRIALQGTIPAGSTLRILRQAERPLGDGRFIRIDAALTGADGATRPSFAECTFGARDGASDHAPLRAFRTERRHYSDVALYILQRFWLESAEADRSDPEPVRGEITSPNLPYPAAYLLQHLVNALPATAMYSMLAAAYSLVYGLVGRINLAFGEMAAIGGAGAIAGIAIGGPTSVGAMIFVSVLAGVWAAGAHGLAVSRWVFLPLRGSTGQQGLVATVGLALVLNEYLRLAQGPAPLWVMPIDSEPHALARSGSFLVTVTPLALLIGSCFTVLAVMMVILIARSQFGRNWRALSDDAGAAALFGVSQAAVFGQAFALASALAGAAGATAVLVYGSFGTTFGTVLGLKSLLAAVIGGIGSVPGALLGGVAIGGIEAIWSAYFPTEYRDLALYALLVITLIIRPGGFLGYRDLGPRRV